MFDDDLLDMLIDRDPEVRKRGVKRMAQTKDAEALPYLDEVARDDEDAEVRDLARKAGQYIEKNAKTTVKRTPPPPSEPSYNDSLYGDDDDIYDDEEIDDTPLPSEIQVSAAVAERAQGLAQSALSLNMQGQNEKAQKALAKALQLDPRLMYDSYTIGLAGTITGQDGKEAVQRLGPDADQLEKMKHKHSSASAPVSGFHRLMGIGVMFGTVVVLVAYFMFPWIDLSSIEVIDQTTNETITLGEQLDQSVELLEVNLAGAEDTELIDAARGIRFEFTGLETTTITLGMQSMLDVTGTTHFYEVLASEFGGVSPVIETDDAIEPVPLDYSLLLIPIMAIISLLLSFVLIRNIKVSPWLFAGLIGLIGMGPMVYFYLSVVTNFDLEAVSASAEGVVLTDLVALDLIGLGYWIGLAGMALLLVLPFIGLIMMPESD